MIILPFMYLGKCTVIVLILIWSLVEVHSQTEYPYVSFMGGNLPNHSYVDLTRVGNGIGDSGNTVRCHTNLETCCTMIDGVHRGNWYFPYGNYSILPFAYNAGGSNIVEDRDPQVVHIVRLRNNAMSPSGIYRCEIETMDDIHNVTLETVYVGLYPPNEGIFTSYIISCIIRTSEEIMS